MTERAGDRPAFRFALGVTFLSGLAAMSHQLLWTRRLIDLLGAGHEASARVFGVFFWASRSARRWRR